MRRHGLPWNGCEPRAWQPVALAALVDAMRGGTRRPLAEICTGAGKSLLIAELAARCKGRVLVTVPSQALVDQLAATIRQRCPGEVGRYYQHAREPYHRIVVCCGASLPQLVQRQASYACWISDEAHRGETPAFTAAAAQLSATVAIGITATPYRSDGRGLQWDRLVYRFTASDAVQAGVLVPLRVVHWRGDGSPDVERLTAEWVAAEQTPCVVSAATIADAESTAERLGGLAVHQDVPPAERVRRLELLHRREIRCVTHVRLLTEGIDLPWLHRLVLRVPIESPVQLVQSVGRIVRAYHGKREAICYDPYDLLGRIGLTHTARLSADVEAEQQASAAPPAEDWRIPELAGLGGLSTLPEPVAVSALAGWAAELLRAMQGAGLVTAHERAEQDSGRRLHWRGDPATSAQRARLERLGWAARYVPGEHYRKAVRWLSGHHALSAGAASDLISMLGALADASKPSREMQRHYKLPIELPPIELPQEAQ